MEETIKRAHDDGFVETMFGRRRWTPDVKSSNFVVRSAAERAAANMPIQGTEADLMKLAMIKVQQIIDHDFPAAMQLLQIHDSILIECPKGQSEAIAAMLKETMEQICPKLGVRLQVDVASGENWGEV
jgi:DNA polymerase-1